MSDFWKRKMRRYFSLIDFDKDGVISEDDLIGMAKGYASFGKPDKQKADHLQSLAKNMWKLLAKNAEIGNRKTLTVDDFIVSVGKQRHAPELTKTMSGVIHGLHDQLDVDRDGYLKEDEYETIISQLGVPDPSFARKAFKAIDADGDGKLGIDEFTNAFLDFLFSEDEKSPNKLFFGPLEG